MDGRGGVMSDDRTGFKLVVENGRDKNFSIVSMQADSEDPWGCELHRHLFLVNRSYEVSLEWHG